MKTGSQSSLSYDLHPNSMIYIYTEKGRTEDDGHLCGRECGVCRQRAAMNEAPLSKPCYRPVWIPYVSISLC